MKGALLMVAYRTLTRARRTGLPGLVLACIFVLTLAACQSDAGTTPATQSANASASASTPGAQSTSASAPPATTWAELEQRPLRVPHLTPGAACPVTPTQPGISPDFGDAVGNSPVYVIGMTRGIFSYGPAMAFGDPTNPWGGGKVIWQIKPEYQGLVLIRGQQVDGTHALRFNGGMDFTPTNALGTEPLLKELHLKGGNATPPSWPTWDTYTRVQASGCYAYQVDGATFTYVIVFQAQSS